MEKPAYFEDNYAARFLTGQAVIPDDGRIFHRAEFVYDDVAALGNACADQGGLRADLFFRSGAAGVLSIRPVRPGVLRVQIGRAGAQFDQTSPMLLPLPDNPAPGEFTAEADRCTLAVDGYEVQVERFPFLLRVISPQGETIFESEWEKIVDMHTAPPAGLRRPAGQPHSGGSAFLSWRIRNQDRCFGLGEKFTRFEKTGTRATIWQADTCGSNTTDMSYKAVPVIFSTAGWALMLHSSFRSWWELGSFSYATGGLLVDEDKLDLFLILAPTLKEQVVTYTALTGRPQLPPRWAFGLWMSRASYRTRDELREVAARLRAEEIPCDVLHIDPNWMEHGYYNEIGVEVCNFNWNRRDWGAPEDLFAEFARLGFAICLWINPYLSEDSPLYAEGRRLGYLVKDAAGGPARLEFGLAAGMVDFTNPRAADWWQEQLRKLLKQGAAVFKVDFGDRVPAEAVFHNGKTGREMHNLYVHLYAQAVYEVMEQARGQGVIWRRPGYIGSQRFPGCWAGDTQVTWEGMAGALRGGLSAAFTGEAFWSHDIGGFVGYHPSEELYIRWLEFGLLSPFARCHGVTPREPWQFGERALETARYYTRLRYALLPYLLACGHESAESGLPILRPMVLEFPGEPRIDAVDDQYLLGPDLLVAPVLVEGARSRPVYLPKGQWWPLDRPGSAVSGPGFYAADAPLERIPVFVRAGAVIPRYRQAPQHLKDPAPREWLLDIYPGDGQRRLVIADTGIQVTIDYHSEGGAGRIDVSPAPVTLAVRLVDRRPAFLRSVSGAILQAGEPAQGGELPITFSADASAGLSVEFRA